MTLTVNNNFFEKFIERYTELDKQHDRYGKRLQKALEAKDKDKANRNKEMQLRIIWEQDGMEDVLNMMGYKLTMENDKYAVVKKGE